MSSALVVIGAKKVNRIHKNASDSEMDILLSCMWEQMVPNHIYNYVCNFYVVNIITYMYFYMMGKEQSGQHVYYDTVFTLKIWRDLCKYFW